MKLVRYLLPMLMAAGLVSNTAFAQRSNSPQRGPDRGQDNTFDREDRHHDENGLRNFIQTKDNIDLKEKATHLEISGDVRFEYQHINEKGEYITFDPKTNRLVQNFRNLRGGNFRGPRNGFRFSTNDFDVEFNLKFKYTYKKAFAMAQMQLDTPAGIRPIKNDCEASPKFDNVTPGYNINTDTRRAGKGSGENFNVNLKRAFIGYEVLADGVNRFDIEVGRRKLDDIFVSEIQFTNRFDGILGKYVRAIDKSTSFYINLGGFVIDELVNHFGFATEFGLLNICDSGFDIRYSFIDWTKRGRNRCNFRNPITFQSRNSQLTLTYNFDADVWCKKMPIEVYSAVLVNHAARRSSFTNGRKQNLGWYAGVLIGEVEEAGDWSFEVIYEYVEAQAVIDSDVSGIGRGNILKDSFGDVYTVMEKTDVVGKDGKITKQDVLVQTLVPARGNANFKGWNFEFLYAITNNLSLDVTYEFTKAANNAVGGPHHYNRFELEAIYAF